jgi:hypothetical protein
MAGAIMVEEYIMESLSFDPMAEMHDETRFSDGDFLDAALNFLTERFPPYGRDLDQQRIE